MAASRGVGMTAIAVGLLCLFIGVCNGHNITKRTAVSADRLLWTKGQVAFILDSNTMDFRGIQIIRAAIKFYHRNTCIRFKRRTTEQNYIVFKRPAKDVCNSNIGRLGGPQDINLGASCVGDLGPALHEIMHALGFYHEHTRPDRDKYVTVNRANIEPSEVHNFKIQSASEVYDLGLGYDYKSVMHYPNKYFSYNGSPTLTSKQDPNLVMGNDRALTKIDVEKIQRLYGNCLVACRWNNGDCGHICTDQGPGTVICSCYPGFELTSDKKTCHDYDDCARNNGNCQHTCVPVGTYRRCECGSGYELGPDQQSCQVKDQCATGELGCEQDCRRNQCTCFPGFTVNPSNILACLDLNECLYNNGQCEGGCVNTIGSYYCTCPSGFFLKNNGLSCLEQKCSEPLTVGHGDVRCDTASYTVETSCSVTCNKGWAKHAESPSLIKCLPNQQWNATFADCHDMDECATLPSPCADKCQNYPGSFACSCTQPGFIISDDGSKCTDIHPPVITKCPKDIEVDTEPQKDVGSVEWDYPVYSDNSNTSRIVQGPIMSDSVGGVYSIGDHIIKYVVADEQGLTADCSFKIKVKDTEDPQMFGCPTDRQLFTQGTTAAADWSDPVILDNSGSVTVTSNVPPGRTLPLGKTTVVYTAVDGSSNSVQCIFKVEVSAAQCRMAPPTIPNGRYSCFSWILGEVCEPECHLGYAFFQKTADRYTCDGINWRPQTVAPCSKVMPAVRRDMEFTLRYKYQCSNSTLQSQQQAIDYLLRGEFKKYQLEFCRTQRFNGAIVGSSDLTCDVDNQELIITFRTNEPVPKYANWKGIQLERLKQLAMGHRAFFFLIVDGGTKIIYPSKSHEQPFSLEEKVVCGSNQKLIENQCVECLPWLPC